MDHTPTSNKFIQNDRLKLSVDFIQTTLIGLLIIQRFIPYFSKALKFMVAFNQSSHSTIKTVRKYKGFS